jgi:hypothetical protein
MKGGAELLGVSYGTLYGRYRELFGYVKHGWNVSGRPAKLTPLPPAAFLTDPNNEHVFEQGSILRKSVLAENFQF